ncbi:MAG: hypothetical protein O9256_03030 [Rhizobiaceae bacterium]|jgi:hypothetical protein|nr:hypothetical protein [Rhizobiaceae bacterium]
MSQAPRRHAATLEPREHATAFQVARAFYAVAKPTLAGLSRGRDEGVNFAAEHSAELPVAATNLGFALELYLKSVRAWIGLDNPETHDLWVLYKSLPVDVKGDIEHLYQGELDAKAPTEILTLRSIVEHSNTGSPQPPEFPKGNSPQRDVSNLLRRTKSLAVSWRYPQDSVPAGKRYSTEIAFEHTCLVVLANALDQFIHARTSAPYAAA